MADQDLSAKMDSRTMDWITQRRGIDAMIAGLHGVRTIDGYPAFEYTDSAGELLYNKVRVHGPGGSKTFRRDRKGSPAALFNLGWIDEPLARDDTPLIITEGEIDCLSWLTAGATHVLSVPDGAQRQEPGEGDIDPLQDKSFQWLWEDGKLIPGLRKFRKIIIATDADRAGRILAEELAVRLGVGRCWTIRDYGKDCKDSNEVLLKRGSEALLDLLGTAQPMQPSTVTPLPDIPVEDERPSYDCGWRNLDDNLKITFPEFMVISGEPGAGKSQFAFNLMLQLARKHGLPGFVLQFEDHVSRLKNDARQYAQSWSRAGQPNDAHCGDDPDEWVRKRIYTVPPPAIGDEEPEMTMDWVKQQIEAAVLQNGCKIVILDPWNEIEHMWGANESETQYTNRALRELKGWARRLSICLIVVAHPSKGIMGKKPEELTLYDVSGSAAWNNKADHGIILSRVRYDENDASSMTTEVNVRVTKCKDWAVMGRPGGGVLDFQRDRQIYLTPGAKR